MMPLASTNLTDIEASYVTRALASGWISSTGEFVGRFEQALAEKLGRRHVIAVTNGTVALELVLLGLDIGPGDEVIVPALTFVAPAASVRAVGALPVFADVTPESWTIDPEDVRRLVTPRTRAIIAVDLLGHPSEFSSLRDIGVPVIEDAAQAHGALFRGEAVGRFGIASTFSFHANKTITTGEGGCVATDDDQLATKMRLIANHGMTKDRPYWHAIVGRNFRMTNLTAAVGCGQVERWDGLVAARNEVARVYDALLETSPLQKRPVAPWATEACWLYTLTSTSVDRESLVTALNKAAIDARPIGPALSDLPLYAPSRRGEYPVATWVSRSAFWLPTWAGMSHVDVEAVAKVLLSAL